MVPARIERRDVDHRERPPYVVLAGFAPYWPILFLQQGANIVPIARPV